MYEVRDGGAPNTGPTIKFRFSEKAKKFCKNIRLVWANQLVQEGDFFLILWPSHNVLTLILPILWNWK